MTETIRDVVLIPLAAGLGGWLLGSVARLVLDWLDRDRGEP